MNFDFALILLILTLITGFAWSLDKFWLKKRRATTVKNPLWVEYGASFFPVFLLVFVLRSFIVEPFQIPSGSMTPTLLTGDFILVNKYAYGVRLPVFQQKIMEVGEPARGDVMVFRYPEDTSQNYIKRVVGLPGDTVSYLDKRLFINGEEISKTPVADYLHPERFYYSEQFQETLGSVAHNILNNRDTPAYVRGVSHFPRQEDCQYNTSGLVCQVPAGHYFVMGDNRDDSRDSRFWGFVPEENIVGKAFFIWLHFSGGSPKWDRLGTFN